MKAEATLQFDPGQTEHAPELYAEVALAEPLDGLDAIDDAALARYDEDGYLAIENAFTPEEVASACVGLRNLVMGKHEGYNGIAFEAKAKDILPTLSLEDRFDAIRKFMNYVGYEPLLHAMAFHPKLISVLKRMIGPKVHLFQDMALVKPPRIGREKPWHQDHAYFNLPMDARVVGVWIALDAATVENGCMRVLSGGHHEGPRLHFARRDWQICDRDMAGVRPVAVPLRPGGLMLFDGLLPHGTPTNHSPHRRRALQFHYHAEEVKQTTPEERLAVFGSEGKDVSC